MDVLLYIFYLHYLLHVYTCVHVSVLRVFNKCIIKSNRLEFQHISTQQNGVFTQQMRLNLCLFTMPFSVLICSLSYIMLYYRGNALLYLLHLFCSFLCLNFLVDRSKHGSDTRYVQEWRRKLRQLLI